MMRVCPISIRVNKPENDDPRVEHIVLAWATPKDDSGAHYERLEGARFWRGFPFVRSLNLVLRRYASLPDGLSYVQEAQELGGRSVSPCRQRCSRAPTR
jgi:hypothetical protein